MLNMTDCRLAGGNLKPQETRHAATLRAESVPTQIVALNNSDGCSPPAATEVYFLSITSANPTTIQFVCGNRDSRKPCLTTRLTRQKKTDRDLTRQLCRILRGLMHPVTPVTLLALQCFVALVVAIHNWIPLGTLNDLKGVRAVFRTSKILITTFINFTPVAIGLAVTTFLLWQSLSWLALLVVVGDLRACMLRLVDSIVDSISSSARARACRSISSNVRRDAFLFARAQWHPAKRAAYDL